MPWPSSAKLGHRGEPGDGGWLGAGQPAAGSELGAELASKGRRALPARGKLQQTGERRSEVTFTPAVAVSARGRLLAGSVPAGCPP